MSGFPGARSRNVVQSKHAVGRTQARVRSQSVPICKRSKPCVQREQDVVKLKRRQQRKVKRANRLGIHLTLLLQRQDHISQLILDLAGFKLQAMQPPTSSLKTAPTPVIPDDMVIVTDDEVVEEKDKQDDERRWSCIIM